MTTPEKSVEEIVEEKIGDTYFRTNKGILRMKTTVIDGQQYYRNVTVEDLKDLLTQTLQAERQKREEAVEEVMWNLNAKIEEADFARKVGEKTGNAEAVYEVQDVLRQIKALTQPNNK